MVAFEMSERKERGNEGREGLSRALFVAEIFPEGGWGGIQKRVSYPSSCARTA